MMDGNFGTDITGTTTSNVIALDSSGSVGPGTPHRSTAVAPVGGGLPAGYLDLGDGIYFLKEDDDGNEMPQRICSPLKVVALCCRTDSTGWGRVVDVIDPDGKTNRFIVDDTFLSAGSGKLMSLLVDRGLRVEKGKEPKQRLIDLLSDWRPEKRVLRVTQLGWIDESFDTFAFADGTSIGAKACILESDTGTVGHAMKAKGSSVGWKDTIGAACIGNPLLLLAVSQSFAGPLLAPLGTDGGGFHFRGSSSTGKTTLLHVAGSVWGSQGYVHDWRTTDNALESAASASSSALLALNEIAEVQPRIVGEIIYMLANGRGRARRKANGTGGTLERWHVAILSSGEVSLEAHMASARQRIHDGQKIRLLDIVAENRKFGAFDALHDKTDPGQFADYLERAANDNHGSVGKLFVENLIGIVGQTERFRRFVDRFVEEALKEHGVSGDGQTKRALKRFALAALAGEMATQFGLTGWPNGAAKTGILEVCGTWLEEQGAKKKAEIDSALEATRSYLAAHPTGFEPVGPTAGVGGWRDADYFYFKPDTWVGIHGRDAAQEAARLHKGERLLKSDRGDTLQLKMGHAVPGRPKVYAIRASIQEKWI